MDKIGNTYSYKIEGRDLDFSKRPTLMSLSDYILQAAGQDADKYGFGIRELNCNNCSWVLSRMAVEFETLPEQYQTIQIHTWVGEIGRMMTTRNFIITDQSGTRIGGATSLWAMIDINTRHPMDLRTHTEYTSVLIDKPSPIAPIMKLGAITPTLETSHRVVYSDLDFNQHTNSMKYLEWFMNMLPLEWHQHRTLHRYDVHYLHEALYGEELQIGCTEATPAMFEIKNSSATTICRAAINFK